MSTKCLECKQVITSLLTLLLLSGVSDLGAAWVNATGNLAGLPSECEEIPSVWAVPGVNKIITGVSNNGLYATSNGGTAWTKISGTSIGIRLLQMHFDPDHPNSWYAGGIYHTPGIFKTTDAGATWTGLGTIGTNDGFAVDFSDPQRQTLLAGGHEAQNILWKSTNGGQTWTNIGGPGGGYSSFPVIINTQTYLMGISNGSGGGVYRSTNAGGAWTKVSTTTPANVITKVSSGEFYYAGGGKVVRGSSDGSTWTVLAPGFNAAGAAPIELPGGKIAVVQAGGISISADKGVTWKTGCRPLPTKITGWWNFNNASGLAYNSVAGAFYTFYWNCVFTNAAVGTDQVWRFDTLITEGTSVVKPRRALSITMNPAREDGAILDISCRNIQHS
jgi:hypothetical protein